MGLAHSLLSPQWVGGREVRVVAWARGVTVVLGVEEGMAGWVVQVGVTVQEVAAVAVRGRLPECTGPACLCHSPLRAGRHATQAVAHPPDVQGWVREQHMS